MINSPGLAGPLPLEARLSALCFLPPGHSSSPDFISSDLLLSLNNKYPEANTLKNQTHRDSAEIGITFI